MHERRWNVLSRCLAAAFGGYALANTLPVAITMVALPGMARSDAALIALQSSFVVYTGAVMWAFAARHAWRAWLGLGVAAMLAALVAWMSMPRP